MLVTHLRSSMIGSKTFCAHKTFIVYNLSIKENANFKADAGNAVHKALELLGLRKFAQQNGHKIIENEALDRPYELDEITTDKAFNVGWSHYKGLSPHYPEWNDKKTIDKYLKMYNALLKFKKGRYNPLNLDIVQPEQFFEFEVQKPWAKYEYTIAGETISGYLKLRGTVDLIIRNEDGSYSSLDWKTGRRVDWGIGEWHNPKVKEYEDLEKDNQLLLYYYSLVNMLKTYDISSIIYYLQDGGPYEFCFDESTYKKAELMIKKEFEEFNNIKVPKLTKNLGNTAEKFYNNRKCGWCDFSKIQPKINTKKSVCEHFRTEIVELGMDKVLDKYSDPSKFSEYTGGGKQSLKKEEFRD